MAYSPSILTLLSGGLCAAALLGPPRLARAEQPSAADRATARTLAQEGYDALRAEQYSIAADRFERANALVHAPTLLRDLARAQVGLGRLLEARDTYRQVIAEVVPRKSPASWARAVEEARHELAALEARLPLLTINVSGPPHPRVMLDGAAIPESELGVKRATDPGRHQLSASGEGYHEAHQVIALREGEALTVALQLKPLPAPVADRAAPAPAAPILKPKAKDPGWRKPAMVGAFALGGAGIAVGSVTGILAMTKHNQLVQDCPERTCGPDQASNYDDFHTLGAVSTIGFIVGGVGLGTGVVLLLVKPKAAAEAPAPLPNTQSVKLSPFIGVGAAGVRGSF